MPSVSKIKSTHIVPSPVERELKGLGNRIRTKRKNLKWTLASLASRCNCSVPTLRSLEQGKGTVSISVLMNVLWCLNAYKDISAICKITDSPSEPVDQSWKDI